MKNNPFIDYINLSDWILDHINQLDLDTQETIVLLQLEYLIRKQKHIDPKLLSKQCNLSVKDFDKNLTSLIQKGYVKVLISEQSVGYELQNLFSKTSAIENKSENRDILDIFEQEFKRPLSTHEIDKLNDWLMKIDYAYIVHALREAVIYQKVNFNYIDRILVSWLDKGLKLEDLDAGKKS